MIIGQDFFCIFAVLLRLMAGVWEEENLNYKIQRKKVVLCPKILRS